MSNNCQTGEMSLNQSWYSLSSSSRCQCQDALGDPSSRLLMTKSVQISPLTRTGLAGMSGIGLGGQGISHQENKWQTKEDRFVCLVYPNVFVYRDNVSISRILRVKCWWLKTCMNLYEQMEGQMKNFLLKRPRGQSISRNVCLYVVCVIGRDHQQCGLETFGYFWLWALVTGDT